MRSMVCLAYTESNRKVFFFSVHIKVGLSPIVQPVVIGASGKARPTAGYSSAQSVKLGCCAEVEECCVEKKELFLWVASISYGVSNEWECKCKQKKTKKSGRSSE